MSAHWRLGWDHHSQVFQALLRNSSRMKDSGAAVHRESEACVQQQIPNLAAHWNNLEVKKFSLPDSSPRDSDLIDMDAAVILGAVKAPQMILMCSN